jgi:hypothetical protein
MRNIFLFLLLLLACTAKSQIENIIIVTTDGLRWQEVFKGIDPVLVADKNFNQGDSAAIMKQYGGSSEAIKRRNLLPFLWDSIVTLGQIYGNRAFGNKVDNSNPYWFSYPGYSEIFCGFVDTLINTNDYQPNPNTNVLEFINKHEAFKERVAVFAAWDAFDRILNEQRSGIPVICGKDMCGLPDPDEQQQMLNSMKATGYNPFLQWGAQLDVYVHYPMMDHLKKKKPRVMYISYGETDEWAHEGHYHDYLDAAHRVDQYLREIWTFVQSDPQYKNKTALFISVDHGRGDAIKAQWTSHNSKIADAHEMWFAVMGPGIPAKGEIKKPMQLWQKQFAQTFTELLGLNFTCEHPVAPGLKSVLMEK